MAPLDPEPPVRAKRPEVLTLSEAAEYLRVSEESLRELAESNQIAAGKVGEEWRFLRKGLRAFLMKEAPAVLDTVATETLFAELQRRLLRLGKPQPPVAEANRNQQFLSMHGAWKGDETALELLREIYRNRGRAMTEEEG